MKYESNIIEIKGLTKVYTDGVGVRALDGVDLAIKKGEFLSIRIEKRINRSLILLIFYLKKLMKIW
jgi:hypothetical protein